MAFTANQVSDAFQSQLGRAPTDYEMKTYATASPQTLASLKSTYGGYNANTSILDYMKFNGKDPATIPELAKQYGIGNIGTAEGNTALLSALKSGKPPPTTPAVEGSIAKAPVGKLADAPIDTAKPLGTNANPVPSAAPGSGGPNPLPGNEGYSVGGSAAASSGRSSSDQTTYAPGTSGTDPSTGNPFYVTQSGQKLVYDPNNMDANQDPSVQQAKDAYTSAQKAVQTLDAQIADINNTLATTLQNKIKEVAASGGLVDEAQLKSIVAAENAPLLNERNTLMSQRSSYASTQSAAGTAYNNALSSFYKSITASQQQQKITDQEQQFSQKLAQSGYKEQKVNVYDAYGDVIGQKVVWVQNPASTTGYTSDGTQVDIKQGSSGAGITADSSGNPTPSASASSPSQAPKTIDLQTGPLDVSVPGYTTAMVKFNGVNTQLTQSYIDQIAIAAIMNGGTIPSGSVRGTKGLPILQTDVIKARMGQLDPGGNLAQNKAEAKAWGTALTQQISYVSSISASLSAADAAMQNIVDTYKNSGIDQGIPIANAIANAAKYNLGSAQIAAFKTSITELQNLYQQVFAKNGQVTDAVRSSSYDAINANMSMDQITAISKQLQALGQADVKARNSSIQGIEQNYGAIIPGGAGSGGSGGAGTGSAKASGQSDSDYVEKTLDAQGLSYNDIVAMTKKGGDHAGQKAVIDNSSGTVGFIDPSEFDSSLYTSIN
jgi:hypothetical protein